jgi:hypothetical protein
MGLRESRRREAAVWRRQPPIGWRFAVRGCGGLLLGYAAVPEPEIDQATARLARALAARDHSAADPQHDLALAAAGLHAPVGRSGVGQVEHLVDHRA